MVETRPPRWAAEEAAAKRIFGARAVAHDLKATLLAADKRGASDLAGG